VGKEETGREKELTPRVHLEEREGRKASAGLLLPFGWAGPGWRAARVMRGKGEGGAGLLLPLLLDHKAEPACSEEKGEGMWA
jgi:hypothetical protein